MKPTSTTNPLTELHFQPSSTEMAVQTQTHTHTHTKRMNERKSMSICGIQWLTRTKYAQVNSS